jgi:U32 family peptidase
MRLPELLAPAGDWECARAAVENGADAIYFGLEKFNARMRANNFTEADLPQLMEFLHRRGVKGYLTFNILVFEHEIAEAEHYLRTMIAAGVDAAVVQDVGMCRLIRQISPDFPIHVSTQMTISSANGVEFARELGCNLVVLARECSLREIEQIQCSQLTSASSNAASPALPLEVFVHGALCVAYSGQCLTSEALGGRSANRGECAQACRMPYELVADGQDVPLDDRKYLLSPQDLAGLDVLPELVRLGVASLKIEGRLKSPEYVANITRVYRRALDEMEIRSLKSETGSGNSTAGQHEPGGIQHPVISQKHSGSGSEFSPRPSIPGTPLYEMEMAFSRGLFTGWFRGTNNQALVHGQFGKKRGVYLGQVVEVRRSSVVVKLDGVLKPGDGVVFDAGRPEEKEEGGRVYEVRSGPAGTERRPPGLSGSGLTKHADLEVCAPPAGAGCQMVEISFGSGSIDFKRVHVGDRLWKTSDPELERRLRQSYETRQPRFLRPVSMEVHGIVGKPLKLIIRDEHDHVASRQSSMPLLKADRQPLTIERLRDQFGRLGGTPFRLGELHNSLEGDVLLPISELNRLRREVVADLEAQRAQPLRWTICNPDATQPAQTGGDRNEAAIKGAPHLIVLARTLEQLDAALQCGVETLYCDFEDPKKYREAAARVRSSALRNPHSALFVAPPRIFKMGEEWTLKQVRSCEADGYLVRNYDHLRFFSADRCVGDYSLNITNRLAADYFKIRFGLERVTASYDLNFAQLKSLLQASPPAWFEVTIHQHIPMFHMEHCLFCAFLSKGTDYTNCGRPCDKHDLKIRDRVGAQHPVKADCGCRNTVFNTLAQTGAEHVSHMLALGVCHFRIELLNETREEAARTISKYRQLLKGEITGAQVWRDLKLINQLGVTRGQMGTIKG